MYTPRVELSTLDRGLRTAVVELPHLHTATLAVFVKAGPRYESPQENGLSHFVEHMLHRGTEGHPSSLALNRAFESLGGSLVAETGRDYSSFTLSVATDRVGDGLDLLGDLFARPLFSDIELERALILEELSADYDERGNEINGPDLARELMFGDHPLGQRIVGPIDNVKRFTVDDVRRFFARLFGAHNLIVAVAGPSPVAQLTDAIARAFRDVPAGEPPPGIASPVAPASPRFRHVPDSGSQTSLDLVWWSIPETDPAYMASAALARVIDDGMSTRLHYQLADQLGLAYSVSGGIEPLHDVALFEISAQTANAKSVQLARKAIELCSELCETAVSDDELDRVKQRYRFELASSIDDAPAMAGWFGGTSLFYPPPSLDQRAEAMDSITPDDVLEAARRVFSPVNLSAVAVGALSRARQAELRELILRSLAH